MFTVWLGWVACGGGVATPAGPLAASGPLPLPAGVIRPAQLGPAQLGPAQLGPAQLERAVGRAAVCGAPGFAPAEVAVSAAWFRSGADRVIAEVDVALVEAAPGLQVAAEVDTAPASLSLTPGAPWDGVAAVHVRCVRRSWRAEHVGADLIQVSADGVLAR